MKEVEEIEDKFLTFNSQQMQVNASQREIIDSFHVEIRKPSSLQRWNLMARTFSWECLETGQELESLGVGYKYLYESK